ncbi:MAG: hypothetical protein Q9188_004706 [Gyalolechia gomerana]
MGGYCGNGTDSARRQHAYKEQVQKQEKTYKKQVLKEERERHKEAPAALAPVRKRSLTLPLPAGKPRLWHTAQRTQDQLQYSETIEILYTENVFCFQDCLSLQYFLRTVLPPRLSQISTIQLPWIKTYLGFPWPQKQVNKTLEMLRYHLVYLEEIRIVRVQDQASWTTTWIYPQADHLITQVMRKTSAKIIGGW